MAEPVIEVRDLGKRYRLGATLSHNALRDHVAHAARAAWSRLRGGSLARAAAEPPDRRGQEFWALREVSFEVARGEVVGVIGRNGAGKSTLLKILSEITEPTTGEIRIRGRVASLLEVGTGFHPELTGRENVYLNGAILGMTRAEIASKYGEIVAFAELDRFMETPVKRYSSGMYVRLAFAVAAHLEPEILLVDEVLAVGDAAFRRKCMGKMSGAARGGRTVLFVSHNMAAVESLCSRTLLLEDGRLAAADETARVVARYLGAAAGGCGQHDLRSSGHRAPGARAVLRRLSLKSAAGEDLTHIPLGEDVVLEVEGETPERLTAANLAIRVNHPSGQRVATCHSGYQHAERIDLDGRFRLTCRLRNVRLMPGTYALVLVLKCDRGLVDEIEGLSCEVTPRDVYGTGKMLPPRTGAYVPEAEWRIETG